MRAAETRAAISELEDNDLATGTMALVERIRPHLGTILLAAVALFAALAAWGLVSAQRAAQRAAAWDECLGAMAEGDPARLEELLVRHAGSAAAQWAELVLADTALAEGNMLALTDPQRGRGRLEAAVRHYAAVNVQRPRGLAAERGILGLAQARESLGELDEARRGYQALVAEHPESPFRPLADKRIAALGRAATERWYKWFESRPVAAPAEPARDAPRPDAEPAASEPAASEPAASEPAAAPAG